MQVSLNYNATARCLTNAAVFPAVAVVARASVAVHEVRAIAVKTRIWAAVVDVWVYII